MAVRIGRTPLTDLNIRILKKSLSEGGNITMTAWAIKRKADRMRFVISERLAERICATLLASCFASASASKFFSRSEK